MILRKPFAILIKNFKRIHLILAVLACYLVYKTSSLSSFFTTYIASPVTLLDPAETNRLLPLFTILIPIVLILGCATIMVLMRFKKKPVTFYIVSIIVCIITLLAYTYAAGTLSGLEINLTDIRTLKLNQDILRTTLVVQFIMAVIMIIRTTGFDIKKFDFNKDLEQLDIAAADNEEFEVNVEFEEGKYRRNWNRFRRYAKYVLKENKLAITILFGIVIIGIGVFVYLNITVFHKTYQIGEFVNASDFGFTFEKVYQTNFDYKGKETENKSFVIVNFEAQNYNTLPKKLETARLYLQIENHKFYHNKDLNDAFFDLGQGYADEKLDNQKYQYSFIYEIPRTLLKYDMNLYYTDGLDTYKIKINPKEIKQATNPKTYNINEKIDFAESILGQSSLQITTFELAERFKNTYQYCINADNCHNADEYIIPTFTGNESKIIMKLSGNVSLAKNIQVDVDTLLKMVQRYGVISYQIGNATKQVSNMDVVKPIHQTDKNVLYLEVNRELADASKIWITFTVRDKMYQYNLK